MTITPNTSDTTTGGTAERMRAWARGTHPSEAGVERLIRSGLADRGDVAAGWPTDGGLDQHSITTALEDNGALFGGQRRLGLIALSLLVGGECDTVDLSDVLPGLDRAALDLVLAALAHAGGSHEHADVRYGSDGQVTGFGTGYLPPLHPWP